MKLSRTSPVYREDHVNLQESVSTEALLGDIFIAVVVASGSLSNEKSEWGYMSTKGITDMLYVPTKFSNHYLKDDCLYISYGGKIREAEPSQDGSLYEKYTGFDERIWGSEIIGILKGARLYYRRLFDYWWTLY